MKKREDELERAKRIQAQLEHLEQTVERDTEQMSRVIREANLHPWAIEGAIVPPAFERLLDQAQRAHVAPGPKRTAPLGALRP